MNSPNDTDLTNEVIYQAYKVEHSMKIDQNIQGAVGNLPLLTGLREFVLTNKDYYDRHHFPRRSGINFIV